MPLLATVASPITQAIALVDVGKVGEQERLRCVNWATVRVKALTTPSSQVPQSRMSFLVVREGTKSPRDRYARLQPGNSP
jgi:hypothetical protein